MKALKALQSTISIFLLIIGFLSPAFISNPVQAESNSGQTTLYFTDALDYSENSIFSEFGLAPLTQTPPTKQNDSKYPPSLFIKNSTSWVPNINIEQLITWFSTSWLLYFLNESEDYDFSFLDEIFSGFEIILPNPFRIVEEYTYTGNDTIKINGDILYNLYFKPPTTIQKSGDNVTVALYSINLNSGIPSFIKISNTTTKLSSGKGIYNQQIILNNVNFTLDPGETLFFSIEIVPVNKTISTFIADRITLEKLEKLSNFLISYDKIQTLQEVGTFINETLSALKQENITTEQITSLLTELINSMVSSSLIYASVNHPAAVTIPAKIVEENIQVYYLHKIPEMNENQPDSKNQSECKLTETPTLWTSEPYNRNKIIKLDNISAILYFDYYQILNFLKGKFTITTTLYDNNTTIASSEKLFDRLTLLEFVTTILTKPKIAVIFTFSGLDYELTYGHSISIAISQKNGSAAVSLLYDSSEYPSALRVKLEETQNIQITSISSTPSNGIIIPGELVEYVFNVTCEKNDILQVSSTQREKIGDWDIILPDDTTISANSQTKLKVVVKSQNNLKEAYGNLITLNIVVSGKTGIDSREITAEVSEDAILYDVEILGYSNSINISKGENRSFYFIIKNNNTGAIDDVDSYTITASSKNNWSLIPLESIRNLPIGESTQANDARVVILVPKNATFDSDIVTIIVTSDGNPSATASINVTVHVTGGDFLEEIYDLFDSVAERLGLNDIFGPYGAIALVSIIMVIILFLIIILVLVFTTKPVRIICVDRIKEIDVTEKAIFELTLQNPSKQTQSYEIFTQQTAPSSKWSIDVEPRIMSIDGRQSKILQILVTPEANNNSKDWTQVTVQVKKSGRKTPQSIDLIAMIKEGKTLLKLENVSHWPTVFNPGEMVTTSFSISNTGTISASNMKIFFYINGKQKNVLNVTIPPRSSADIQIPWIAVSGKNAIRIRIKE